MKKQNTNKGITLIALVITIIVMLILVGVTISMAVNGGLFEYAGRAASETNRAMANEKELANLDVDMTVDELIDKYTGATKGVDPNLLNIGDYVNYPVQYSNVSTSVVHQGSWVELTPKDEYTGWRILSKETDENGNVLYVKLISAGVPLIFRHMIDQDPAIEALTTNFLTTEVKPGEDYHVFTDCGFYNVTNGNLTDTFINKYTDKVQSLTTEELIKACSPLIPDRWYHYYSVVDPSLGNLFAIPCNEASNVYFPYWMATGFGDNLEGVFLEGKITPLMAIEYGLNDRWCSTCGFSKIWCPIYTCL